MVRSPPGWRPATGQGDAFVETFASILFLYATLKFPHTSPSPGGSQTGSWPHGMNGPHTWHSLHMSTPVTFSSLHACPHSPAHQDLSFLELLLVNGVCPRTGIQAPSLQPPSREMTRNVSDRIRFGLRFCLR